MSDTGRRSRILVVNDDPETLDLIAEILRKDEAVEVRLSRDAREGGAVTSEFAPDLIMCSLTDAADWVRFRLRLQGHEETNSFLLLLVCDRGDVGMIGRSLEQGVDDYIEKGLCPHILLPRIRSLVGVKRLQEELKAEEERLSEKNTLLKRNFEELTAILLKILEVRVPGASDRARDAKTCVKFIAEKLHFPHEKRKQIVFAGLLHEIGKVGLPDGVAGKQHLNLPAELRSAYRQHPTIGSMIISTMTGYRESAEAVHHQLENYDGSGFPDGLMGEEIPSHARILRAVVFYEELRGQGCAIDAIIEQVHLAIHSVLEQRIANLLIEFLREHNVKPETNKLKLRVDDLKPGMVIAEDVYAASGVKLLPKGVQLRDKTLALLLERNETDPVLGGIYILTDWSLLYGT
jgi:response regulator RpfG family c-di-GMP phosphodiesterase